MLHHHRTKKYFWPVVVGSLFLIFFVTASFYYISNLKKTDDATIYQNLEELSDIFKQINDSCKIVKFDHDKDNIDFLNTITFAGSNVGPMHLSNPENWKGPYLKKEYKAQGIPYQIVKAKQGFYIVPGDGVKLQNGKVMAKDIIINATTDIESLLNDPDALLSKNGKQLAKKVAMTINPFDLLTSNQNIFDQDY